MNSGPEKWEFLKDFKSETCEHITHLNQWILKLKQLEPGSSEFQSALEQIWREIHNVKAASRMMGFRHMEQLSHHLEELLGALQSGLVTLHSHLIDAVLQALDALLAYAQALPKTPSIPLEALCENLQRLQRGEKPKPVDFSHTPQPKGETEPALLSPLPDWTDTETLRIRTERLDKVFQLVEEFTILQGRLQKQLEELNELCSQLRWAKQRDQAEWLNTLFSFANRLAIRARENVHLFCKTNDELREAILNLRMVPLKQLFAFIPRFLHDLLCKQKKEAELTLEGENIEVDRKLLEELKEPLLHLLNNCIVHGLEKPEQRHGKPRKGKIILKARQQGGFLLLTISDDGRGMQPEKLRQRAIELGLLSKDQQISEEQLLQFVFQPGFSTAEQIDELAGRGVGLDIVQRAIQNLKGTIRVSSKPGQGTTFHIQLPLRLSTTHALLVSTEKQTYAFPLSCLREIFPLQPQKIQQVEDRDAIVLRGKTLPLVDLAQLLGFTADNRLRQRKVALAIENGEDTPLCFGVDQVLCDEQLVVKTLGAHIRRIPCIQGAGLLQGDQVVLILNPYELVQCAKQLETTGVKRAEAAEQKREKKRVLVVDDSITTRKLEQAILQAAGYEVDEAVNGKQALEKLKRKSYHIVIADVQMPVLDGWGLLKEIRKDPKLKEIPVIVVSSLDKKEEVEKSLALGAKAHITKGEFRQDLLIQLIERLTEEVGEKP